MPSVATHAQMTSVLQLRTQCRERQGGRRIATATATTTATAIAAQPNLALLWPPRPTDQQDVYEVAGATNEVNPVF